MARTKKYLSSKGQRTKAGFYRPIKRTGSTASKKSEVAKKTVKKNTSKTDISEEIKKLKTKAIEKKKKETSRSNPPKLKLLDKKLDKKYEEDISISLDSGDIYNEDRKEEVDFVNHDEKEDKEFLEMKLDNSEDEKGKLKKEIEALREQYEQEKKKLEREVNTLRKDLHRTEPIDHNKFFSISKELDSVVKQMDKLVSSAEIDGGIERVDVKIEQDKVEPIRVERLNFESKEQELEEREEAKEDKVIETKTEVKKDSVEQNSKEKENEKKKRKIPKILVILGSTIMILLLLGGATWFSINKKTKVSEELLQEYLPEEAQNKLENELGKKISESLEENLGIETEESKGETKGASTSNYEESQADIPFSETYWDTMKAPIMGIEMNYPKNTVNMIKTESSVTFIRKTGYIFKVQLIESALTVKEYWKMIKASSLNYNVKETTFRDQDALFLELEDFSEYPGDRYLVKKGDFIYDIWYATYSDVLTDDDAKRVDIMLNSFKFFE